MPAKVASQPSLVRLSTVSTEPTTDRGWIRYHPRYESFLKKCGLRSAIDALDYPGEVVCGHPDRHVVRAELRSGGARRTVYIKREHLVPRKTSWRSWRAGFGWVSKCEREAAILDQLEQGSHPAPQWLAVGRDHQGRAFLIIDEVTDAPDLRQFLAEVDLTREDRELLAEKLGQAIAELHEAGFATPELSAKHLLLHRRTFRMTIIDWQSAPRPQKVDLRDRIRSLAMLDATLRTDLASDRERLRFLRTYLRCCGISRTAPIARELRAESQRLANRSSIRDQRTPASDAPSQRLVWLAGEAVCVIPELVADWPHPAESSPFYLTPYERTLPHPDEEWVTFASGQRGLLTRFSTWDPLGRRLARLREKPWRSPAARLSRILFHLQRHGIPGPKLLAFGQRLVTTSQAESFLVEAPLPGSAPLPTTLEPTLAMALGRRLRSLHEVGLRVIPEQLDRAFVVLPNNEVGIASSRCLTLHRRVSDRARQQDCRRLAARFGALTEIVAGYDERIPGGRPTA